MKTAASVSLAFLLLVDGVSAQSLYLTCKATSYTNVNFDTIYKTPPANARDQFLEDMMLEGLLDVLVRRSESWVVALQQGRISSPEENSGPQFADATVTDARISAKAFTRTGSYSFELNRITGKLTYQIYLVEGVTKAWRQKHGGVLPTTWTWEQNCIAASRTKI